MAFDNIQPSAIDLFCGAGGLSLGLQNADINVRLGIEINPIAAETYQNNLPGYVLIRDIKTVTSEEILNMLNMAPGELFLLAGCPPCQTFSSLQKDDVSNDDRNNLIFEYVRLIQGIRPLFIQMENVPGLKRGKGKKIFTKALLELSEEYEIISGILNCADYGIPQQRKRLVLHGIRKDAFSTIKQNSPDFILELPSATHAKDPGEDSHLLPWVPSRVAFLGLPAVAAGDHAPNGYPNHETNALSAINLQRITYIQQHGGSRTCLPDELQLPCHKKRGVGYTGVYGIIDESKPAPTITGGCINFSKGRYGHPFQARAITVREAARLQSFPDTYIFYGSRGQTALQVGNAVPPHLAEMSGRYFLNLLNLLHNLPD